MPLAHKVQFIQSGQINILFGATASNQDSLKSQMCIVYPHSQNHSAIPDTNISKLTMLFAIPG